MTLKKVLFIVSEDWYFISHRLSLAKSAIDNGYEVTLITRISKHRDYLNSLGIKTVNWPIIRRSLNPFQELKTIYCIIKTVRSYKPDLIYSVGIKPVIYTVLSKTLFNVNGIVLALAGLGFIFRSNRFSAKLIKLFIVSIFRIFLNGSKNIRLIVQNNDDSEIIKHLKIISIDKIRIIHGSGIDINDYFPNFVPHDVPLVILPGRMLWDKGVGDFISCAKRCFNEKVQVRFALVGEPDVHNPESVSKTLLKDWEDQQIIEYWGRRENMLEVYNMSDIVCFPSYHEGLPRALLEAASCEVPIVAYDVSGCREVVKDNENGFLVPFKDENALFIAVIKLLNDSKLRRQMGQKGRQIVRERFTEKKINSETFNVWSEVIK